MSPRYIGTVILIFAAGASLALKDMPPPEPAYRERSLSAWLEDFDSTALYTKETAAEAMQNLGTNALPGLIAALQGRDTPLKLKFVAWGRKQSLVKFGFTPATQRRRQAIKALATLGPTARPAIPALIASLSNSEIANEVTFTLVTIDPGIFPLTRALTNQANELPVRVWAAKRLIAPLYDPQEVIPFLLRSLEDGPPEVAAESAKGLGLLAREPGRAVPVLIESLDASSDKVRSAAAAALGCFGPGASAAERALLRVANDPKRQVRIAAIEALQKIRPQKQHRAGVASS